MHKFAYRGVIGVKWRSNRASERGAQESHHEVYLHALYAILLMGHDLAAYIGLASSYRRWHSIALERASHAWCAYRVRFRDGHSIPRLDPCRSERACYNLNLLPQLLPGDARPATRTKYSGRIVPSRQGVYERAWAWHVQRGNADALDGWFSVLTTQNSCV